MASHRRPKPAGRARVSILTGVAAAAVALSAQSGAHADPQPSKDQVKEQVDQLNEQAEQASEKYNASQEKQQTLQKQVSGLQDKIARQQAQVTDLQGGLAEIAGEQYRNGGISPTVQLMFNSSPDTFLNQAGTLNQVGGSQKNQLKELQGEQRKLDQDRNEAQGKLTELESTTKQLKADKEALQGKLKAAQDLLATLTEQERQQIAAAEAKAAADAKAKVDAAQPAPARASRDSARTDPAASSATPAPVIAPGSSHGAAALQFAASKIGSPYVYGASGPGSFDCSGLMVWAFNQANVSLPRTSQEQAHAGTRIGGDLSGAQPGDLLIFYTDAHHVGIYAGNGMVLHAPKPGASVRYEAVSNMPLVSVVRV
ncbi:NlpC/P60 family protein [Streptomyces sp. NRRL WC-3742]|uniref:NlpC/P60 family protein n=1 Tax=Streptomyces sp. NRRL WC-3742 TaxID=1463934 RepID=UPI0004C5C535|nr:NlpC/P60 family protein [Streptomyces sp. NRRL WC-3742]